MTPTITIDELNTGDIGLSLQVKGTSPTTALFINNAIIDCVTMKVYYTLNDENVSIQERNIIFDSNIYDFGKIDNLMYSKVNETENMLKLKDTKEDSSIFPMIDEFGLGFEKRFIFKSSWDSDYYIRTKNELE